MCENGYSDNNRGNLKHLVEKKILIKYCLLQSLMILPATDDVAK